MHLATLLIITFIVVATVMINGLIKDSKGYRVVPVSLNSDTRNIYSVWRAVANKSQLSPIAF